MTRKKKKKRQKKMLMTITTTIMTTTTGIRFSHRRFSVTGRRGFFVRPMGEEELNWESLEHDMDVSKNRGTPKWMIYNGNPYENG